MRDAATRRAGCRIQAGDTSTPLHEPPTTTLKRAVLRRWSVTRGWRVEDRDGFRKWDPASGEESIHPALGPPRLG